MDDVVAEGHSGIAPSISLRLNMAMELSAFRLVAKSLKDRIQIAAVVVAIVLKDKTRHQVKGRH